MNKTIFVVLSMGFLLITLGNGCKLNSASVSQLNNAATQIDAVEQGEVYKNIDYGFEVTLPSSWKGYEIIMDKWQGADVRDSKIQETGPEITITHPQQKTTGQHMPIMIFTLQQWDLISAGKISVSAAPFAPQELGRSDNYVFALEPGYEHYFNTDEAREEAPKIISTFKTFKINNSRVYNNSLMQITLELPTGWYVSDQAYADPHFYANKACTKSDRPQCTVVELIEAIKLLTGGVKTLEDQLKSEGRPYAIINLIPNATVIKTIPEGGAEGYSNQYYIFFSKEERAFVAFGINHEGDKTAEDLLATLKLVK